MEVGNVPAKKPTVHVLFASGGVCFALAHLMELEDAKGRLVHLQKWHKRLATSKIIPSQLWMCSSLEVFCVISKLSQLWVCVLSFPPDAYLEKGSPKVVWIFKLSLWKTPTTDQFAQTQRASSSLEQKFKFLPSSCFASVFEMCRRPRWAAQPSWEGLALLLGAPNVKARQLPAPREHFWAASARSPAKTRVYFVIAIA